MISYLCTSPHEAVKHTDAIYQEIELLRQEFTGSVTSLFPLKRPSSLVPPMLMGVLNLRTIRNRDRAHQINHIFAAGLFHLPMVHLLEKPIIYTVVGGIRKNVKIPPRSFIKKVDRLVVSSKRDQAILAQKIDVAVDCILPSIATDNFEQSKIALDQGDTMHLLMASAPWERTQFESKGIHLILKALQQVANLHLTFLWRGLQVAHMRNLIAQYGVGDKITFINEKVDVNALMHRMHGTILLCNDPAVIKSYPHSLIESLVCGRPVIATPEIAMSDQVSERRCGLILGEFSSNALQNLLVEFRSNYTDLQAYTMTLPKTMFAPSDRLRRYGAIYESLI